MLSSHNITSSLNHNHGPVSGIIIPNTNLQAPKSGLEGMSKFDQIPDITSQPKSHSMHHGGRHRHKRHAGRKSVRSDEQQKECNMVNLLAVSSPYFNEQNPALNDLNGGLYKECPALSRCAPQGTHTCITSSIKGKDVLQFHRIEGTVDRCDLQNLRKKYYNEEEVSRCTRLPHQPVKPNVKESSSCAIL